MKRKKKKDNTSPKVVEGVNTPKAINPLLKNILSKKRKSAFTLEDYVTGIKNGDKKILSQAITLIESTRAADKVIARQLLEKCLALANKSIRIGITGTPGVGKSTFIEAFGCHLSAQNKRVAVLAIDPSSQISGGSILGDKTRMEKLSTQANVFIRPSPTQTTLGGVARKTRETMVLCEAAGYEMILVETVGVGQSEVLVHSMVDFFLLLLLPGAGDFLQGIKRGIVEMADLVLINKADGDRLDLAKKTRLDYKNALHFFPTKPSKWIPKVVVGSSLEKRGIEQVQIEIEKYVQQSIQNQYFEQNRKEQARYWLKASIQQGLQDAFYNHKVVKEHIIEIEKAVLDNKLSPFEAAEQLLGLFKNPSFLSPKTNPNKL